MGINKIKVRVITNKPTNNYKHPLKGIPLFSIPMMTDQRWNELARQQREVEQLEACRT